MYFKGRGLVLALHYAVFYFHVDQYLNMERFTVEYILSNIQIARCLDHIEILALSYQLHDHITRFGRVIYLLFSFSKFLGQ